MEINKIILIGSALALFLILFMVILFKNKSKKKSKSVVTDAVVVNVDIVRDKETGIVSYFPFVEYVGIDNQVHKAILNSNINPLVGKTLKIKYNPSDYEFAFLVAREEE